MDEQLIFRGSVDAIVKEELLKKLAAGRKLVIKFGIDPTAGRIHIGRAATIRHLKHFQDMGHEVHIIIGSFTGQIGDSSDKEVERKMLSKEEIVANMSGYTEQLSKIFDTGKMVIHYNGDWLEKLGLAEFFKLQQMFSVAQMIERDNFMKRYKASERIGLHEFSYALLQGYDSVAIKADIEIGGTDQLFNLLAGRTIQKYYDQQPQDVITYRLLLGLDGRKMSTSWGNCIYVDDSPKEMFGKLMSISDDLMWDYFEIVSELTNQELSEIKQQLENKVDPKGLKVRLAKAITSVYHSAETAEQAAKDFDSQFVGGAMPSDIEERVTNLGNRSVVELLAELGLSASNSETRRLLEQGGIKLNQEKISSEEIVINDGDVVSVGKHRFIRVKGS